MVQTFIILILYYQLETPQAPPLESVRILGVGIDDYEQTIMCLVGSCIRPLGSSLAFYIIYSYTQIAISHSLGLRVHGDW